MRGGGGTLRLDVIYKEEYAPGRYVLSYSISLLVNRELGLPRGGEVGV